MKWKERDKILCFVSDERLTLNQGPKRLNAFYDAYSSYEKLITKILFQMNVFVLKCECIHKTQIIIKTSSLYSITHISVFLFLTKFLSLFLYAVRYTLQHFYKSCHLIQLLSQVVCECVYLRNFNRTIELFPEVSFYFRLVWSKVSTDFKTLWQLNKFSWSKIWIKKCEWILLKNFE